MEVVMGSWYIDKITIDSREKDRGVNAYNYFINTYDVYVKPLKYGDFLFDLNDGKQVVFEYKTCEDFINSMENKSLFHEISNQSIKYKYSYLIVSGNFDEIYEHLYFGVSHYRYKYKTLQLLKSRLSKQITGALNRIYAMYVPIIFVEDEDSAFEKMLEVSFKIADTRKYGGIVRPTPKRLMENPCALFLTNLDGIGNKKSENITKELNIECLDDLCKRTPSDFISVSRVTEKNVREIWKKVHNEDLESDEIYD